MFYFVKIVFRSRPDASERLIVAFSLTNMEREYGNVIGCVLALIGEGCKTT